MNKLLHLLLTHLLNIQVISEVVAHFVDQLRYACIGGAEAVSNGGAELHAE